MSSPVLMFGLDAFDPDLALEWAAAGELPTLQRLIGQSAQCRVRNPYALFVSALWPSFATGLKPHRHGFHSWDHIEVDSYERRVTRPLWKGCEPFWQALSRGGHRVAIVDVPHARVDAPLNGIQIAEWGCHDRHFGLHSWPPEAAAEIASAFGTHPVFGLDAHRVEDFSPDDYAHRQGNHRTRAEEDALLRDLLAGVDVKHRVLSEVQRRESWDFFLGIFGESHAAGHQLWHRHDSSAPHGRPKANGGRDDDAILQVYRRIDAALGDLLDAAGPEAIVLVLLSHGMAAHHDGTHLLDEVLSRLDRSYRGNRATRPARDLTLRLTRPLVLWMRSVAASLSLPLAFRSAVGRLVSVSDYALPEDRRRQLFFVQPNNTAYSGIRLNLAGREPAGLVDPAEADALCDRLVEDLLALVNVDTGEKAVAGVERCDRHHCRSPRDVMPDLFVDWVRDTPIEAVTSPEIGTVHAPYRYWRSGDHKPDGVLLVRGPDIEPEARQPAIDVVDIAPSLAARLGVSLDGVDGRAIPWLAGAC